MREDFREEILENITLLIKEEIKDKQIANELLDLIDDYGIECYSKGCDDTDQPEFY
jgi:hypothetical protein